MSKLSMIALVSVLVVAPTLAAADASAVVNGAASGAVNATTDGASVGASTDASAAASGTLDSNSASAMVSGSVAASGQLSLGDLVTDIASSGDDSETISAIGSATTASTINIVAVSSLKADASALANAKTSSSDRLTKLRAAVHADAAIEAALTAKGYSDDHVVAVKIDASATIWVYVDDTK
jgi:hypothetical protein